jgi:membrane protein YdbS with pleckstrin-like domain
VFPGSPVREYAVDVISATEPVPSIADGVERKLDPRFIGVQRVSRWLFVGPFALVVLIPVVLQALFSASGMLMKAGPLVVWAAFAGLLVWWAQAWPAMSYRHSSYRVDPLGIEIRRGVVWHRVINVPRSRVQHTDVSQGPLERGSDLGTLVIFTAGTHYARVHLPGLQHATALRIRNHLLPGGSDDAV